MKTDFALAEHLRKQYRAESDALVQALVDGVRDWDQYKFVLGQLNGLARASRELDELIIAMQEE